VLRSPLIEAIFEDDIVLSRRIKVPCLILTGFGGIYLRLIGEDESELRLVIGILEDGVDELQHRSDTGTASDHTNLLLHVRLVVELYITHHKLSRKGKAKSGVGYSLDKEPSGDLLARLEGAELLGHPAVRVLLDQQLKETLLVVGDGSVL